jgi:hypothetical protein
MSKKKFTALGKGKMAETTKASGKAVNWFRVNLDAWEDIARPDGHLEARKFVQAARKLVGMEPGHPGIMDTQEGGTMNRVKARLRTNVSQMDDYFNKERKASGEEFATVYEMCIHEAAAGKLNTQEPSVCRGVLRFTWTLQFLVEAFRRTLEDPAEELATSFRRSYAISLDLHQERFIKPVFNLAMCLCPYKKDFFRLLAADDTLEQTYADARIYFTNMSRMKNRLVMLCNYLDAKFRHLPNGGFDVRFGKEAAGNNIVQDIAEAKKRKHDQEVTSNKKSEETTDTGAIEVAAGSEASEPEKAEPPSKVSRSDPFLSDT